MDGRPHWKGLFSLLEKVGGISKKVRPYHLFEALGKFAVFRRQLAHTATSM
jgi:hypothetical protein